MGSAKAATNLQLTIGSSTDGTVGMQVAWPASFTNRLEIFAATNLISGDWVLACTNISTVNPSPYIWDGIETKTKACFFIAADADLDTDVDWLSDAREIYIHKTLRDIRDTDGDGLWDGFEVENDLNPLSIPGAGEVDIDEDGDALSDPLELIFFGDLTLGPTNDWDGDGLLNQEEFGILLRHDDPYAIDSPWIPAPSNAAAVVWGDRDEGFALLEVGFNFPFFGMNYSNLYVGINGTCSFGSAYGTWNGVSLLPNGNACALAAPFWSDLEVIHGSVYFFARTNDSMRSFIVQWKDVSFYGNSASSLNFQTEFFEDGSLVFRYAAMDFAGTSQAASIGIQGPSGSEGKSWRYSGESFDDIANGLAVLFPPRVLSINLVSYPDATDSDRDGIDDLFESGTRLLNPLDPSDATEDWDLDGLSSLLEYQTGTKIDLADTDGDGFSDGFEVTQGFDPTDPLVPDRTGLEDSDRDGMADIWELHYLGNLMYTLEGDFDGDLLTNGEEYLAGTHPLKSDTDGDGLADSVDTAPFSPGPKISLVQPRNNDVVTTDPFSVEGTVAFGGILDNVTVGGREAALTEADEGWNFYATLDSRNEGHQTIAVTASGRQNGIELNSKTHLSIFADVLPPKIIMLSAPASATFTNLFVHLSVQSDDTAPLFMNGVEMARDGYVNYAWIELAPGENTVEMTSTDKQGRKTVQSMEFYCDVPLGHTEDPPADADADGVLDAFDYAPNDATVQSAISITSFQNGATIPAGPDPEDFDASRTIHLAGTAAEGISALDVHVKSLNGTLGADRYYTANAGGDGRYSLAIELFPGTNSVTVCSDTVSETHRLTLQLNSPNMEIRFSHSGEWLTWTVPWYEHDFEPLINGSEQAGIHRFTVRALADNVNCWIGSSGYSPRAISYQLDILLDGRPLLSKTGTLIPVVTVSEDCSGNGVDVWRYYGYFEPQTLSFILHAGMYAGGYIVNDGYRDVCPKEKQPGRRANPYRVRYALDANWRTEGFKDMFSNSQLELNGPNAAEPVYLLTGQSAQFNLCGISPDEEGGFMGLYSGLTLYCTNGSEQAVVDALGVFSALTPEHYQVGIMSNHIIRPDGTYYTTNDVPNIDVYVIDPPCLLPDYNRDGIIGGTDLQWVHSQEAFRFWINDDDDFGNIAEDDSDVPEQGGLLDNANCDDGQVNGRCDLLDFFPLWLDLHETLSALPVSEGAEYRLRHDDEAVRFVYTDLTIDEASAYRRTEGNSYGPLFIQNAFEADTIRVTDSGVTLNSGFLNRISSFSTKGVLMVEGIKPSNKPLVLEIWKDGSKLSESKLNLSLSGVEDMYRWINLRSVAGGSEDRPTDISEPSNFPDASSNGKNFVFVHGYSVHEEAARAWNAEMFKRLYQSGSHAMFTAVTWRGNSSQIWSWIPFVGGATPDYYENVENAFATAPHLTTQLGNLPGEKVIAGHSLGNMVVSSAIVDHGLPAHAYFMLNAAVAMEAYNETFNDQENMRHPDWQNYSNRLWASEWHSLFPVNDNRYKLTWKDQFGPILNAINYYSTTEDVLDNANGSVPFIDKERAWVCQEMRKGTTLMWIAPGNTEAGWGFNAGYDVLVGYDPEGYPSIDHLPPLQANNMLDSVIRTNSFFYPFDDKELYNETGSIFLLDGKTDVRNSAIYIRLLSDAIPALSNPAGRNSLEDAVQDNRDYMSHDIGTGFRRGLHEDGNWPRDDDRWWHSDIKNIAVPYNHKVYEQIVSDGDLK